MKDPKFAKSIIFINSLVPLALLGWDSYRGNTGANPVEYAIHTTGILTIIFLLLTLAVTPVRLITGRNWLSHFRRLLGLYAFFYACAHVLIYFIFQRDSSIPGVIDDTAKRPFILLGMTALLLMVPLALTSTNGMIKRLGSAKWKRLHQLVYITATLGMIHFYMSLKADKTLPIWFAVVLGLLLLYRILVKFFPALKYRKPAASHAPARV